MAFSFTTRTPGGGLFASERRRTALLALLLAAATLAGYSGVARNGFVNWDDPTYVTDNPYIRGGLHWSTVRWAFTTFYSANWHPLTWISHALDVQWFGMHAAGHHEMTALLHALCAVLLFLALKDATEQTWLSLLAAALFALHPVNVESVAWTAERKNVLSLLFFLLALLAYQRYARRPRIAAYQPVFLFFALGLMAKPQIITLPFVLLLWDYWPLRRLAGDGEARCPARSSGWLIAEKIPLFLLCAASAYMTVISEAGGGALVRDAAGLHAPIVHPLSVRLANALVAYVRYIGHAFWPVRLSALYPHPGNSLPIWQVTASAAALAAITAGVLLARRRRYLAVGWFWFLGTLVPMIGLVQVGAQAMADHYAYLPYIGLFVMIVWGAADLLSWLRVPKSAVASAAAVVVLAAGVLTDRQAATWHDSITLWSHALAVTQKNFVAHDQLAAELLARRRPDEAEAHLRSALALFPDDPMATLNLGVVYLGRRDWNRAGFQFEKVLDLSPDPDMRASAAMDLGEVFRAIGEYRRAYDSYQAVLRLQPGNATAHVAAGLVAEKMGEYDTAAREYAGAMKLAPTDVGCLLLARALRQQGKTAEAQAAQERAASLSRDLAAAQRAADELLNF